PRSRERRALDGVIAGARGYDRGGVILDREGLAAGDRVAAVVGGGPGAPDLAHRRAARREVLVRGRHLEVRVAAVGEGRRPEARRRRALEGLIGRTGGHDRRGVILDRDGLAAGGRVAAAIGGGPGATRAQHGRAAPGNGLVLEGDGEALRAVVGEHRLAERRLDQALGREAAGARLHGRGERGALDGLVGGARDDDRGGVILDGDGLAARGRVATGIGAGPGAPDLARRRTAGRQRL